MVKLSFESNEIWMYLWLKYITGVNLNVHCAKSLLGIYSKKINAKNKKFSIELDEDTVEYFYLCGVTRPYIWKNNFHLAFKKKDGEKFEYVFNGTKVIVENAEKIDFSMADVDWNNPNAKKRDYITCRNWQFANWYNKNVCKNDAGEITQLLLF